MDNLDFQILLFHRHQASRLPLWIVPLVAVLSNCFCNVKAQRCKESDFFYSGQIALDDTFRTDTHTQMHNFKGHFTKLRRALHHDAYMSVMRRDARHDAHANRAEIYICVFFLIAMRCDAIRLSHIVHNYAQSVAPFRIRRKALRHIVNPP